MGTINQVIRQMPAAASESLPTSVAEQSAELADLGKKMRFDLGEEFLERARTVSTPELRSWYLKAAQEFGGIGKNAIQSARPLMGLGTAAALGAASLATLGLVVYNEAHGGAADFFHWWGDFFAAPGSLTEKVAALSRQLLELPMSAAAMTQLSPIAAGSAKIVTKFDPATGVHYQEIQGNKSYPSFTLIEEGETVLVGDVNGTPQRVNVPAFWMAQTDVTVGQVRAFDKDPNNIGRPYALFTIMPDGREELLHRPEGGMDQDLAKMNAAAKNYQLVGVTSELIALWKDIYQAWKGGSSNGMKTGLLSAANYMGRSGTPETLFLRALLTSRAATGLRNQITGGKPDAKFWKSFALPRVVRRPGEWPLDQAGDRKTRFGADDQPAVYVNRYEAKAIAEWLLEKMQQGGLLPKLAEGQHWVAKLPTDAQMEKAMRGPPVKMSLKDINSSGVIPWAHGDRYVHFYIKGEEANILTAEQVRNRWLESQGTQQALDEIFAYREYPTATGGYSAEEIHSHQDLDTGLTIPVNAGPRFVGMFNLAGNVLKWMERNQTERWPDGFRGGSWDNRPEYARAACGNDDDFDPDFRDLGVGFRVVVAAQDSK